jgi:hypothetical protein
MTFNPAEISEGLVARGEQWADLESAASLLEESRRAVRAQIALKFMSEAGSVSKAEIMAEADPLYLAHVTTMVEARRKANIARVNYDTGRVFVELLRSKESTERAMITLR